MNKKALNGDCTACAPEFEDLKGLMVHSVEKEHSKEISIRFSNGTLLTITTGLDICPYAITPRLNISQGKWAKFSRPEKVE